MTYPALKANFAVESKHEAFFTGGKVQVLSNEEHIFTQCGNKVCVLEVASGQVSHEISQEEDPEVTCFVVSPDDKILVVAHQNLILRQWDWREKKVERTWKAIHISPVACMTFDPTSTLLATGGCDASIKVWDVIKKYCTHNLKGHQGVVSLAKFHPDPSKLQLITAGDDTTIRVWSLEKSICLAVLEGHFSAVTCFQFSPDVQTLYSGGRDNVLICWDLQKKEKKKVIPVYESVEGLALLPSQDGGYPELKIPSGKDVLVSGGQKGLLRLWDAESGQSLSPAESKDTTQPAITHMQQTDSKLTVVTYDHNILQFTKDSLQLLRQFVGNNDDIVDIKFWGSHDSHLAVATNSEQIKVYNLSTWHCQILHGHRDVVMSLDVCANGRLLVSSAKDSSARVWRLNEQGAVHCLAVAYGHTAAVLAVALSRLSPSFMVTGSQDLTLKLWTLPSKLSPAKDPAQLQASCTQKAHDKEINSLTVSPNDKLIATGSQDKTAKLWSCSDLALVGVFRGHRRGIWKVQFSPVDQCLASASADGTIKIWSLSDFSCVKTFEGHEGSVLTVQFLCRGMQLLSSGSDGLLKLWTIKSNECIKTYDDHEGKVWAMALNRKEDRIATGASDATLFLWKDVTESELVEARAKREDLILKQQKLENLIQQKKFLKAIALAIVLDQPFRLMNIIKMVMTSDEDLSKLKETIHALRDDQIGSILGYMVQWNTNSKHCHVAQTVLNIVLTSFSPEKLLSLPNIRASLEGLLPYTERHYQRMDRLMQQTSFVDYTWGCMRRVAGHRHAADAKEVKEEKADDSVVGTDGQHNHLMEEKTHTLNDSSSEEETEMEVTEKDTGKRPKCPRNQPATSARWSKRRKSAVK